MVFCNFALKESWGRLWWSTQFKLLDLQGRVDVVCLCKHADHDSDKKNCFASHIIILYLGAKIRISEWKCIFTCNFPNESIFTKVKVTKQFAFSLHFYDFYYLPRAGQISNMPSRSLQHAVLIPVTTGLFPLFLLSCNEGDIASDTKTSCFGIVEGLSFIVKCRFFPTKTSCFAVVMVGDTFWKRVTFVINWYLAR